MTYRVDASQRALAAAGCKRLLIFIFLTCTGFSLNGIAQEIQWERMPFPDSCKILDIAVNPSGDLFVGVQNTFGITSHGCLYRTPDYGTTWTQLSPTPSGHISSITSDDQGLLFAGSTNSILRSTDNGETWTEVYHDTLGSFEAYRLAAGFDSIVMMAGTSHTAILRSGDHGLTWTVVYTLPGWSWQWFTDIIFSPDTIIYASSVHAEAGYKSLFRSADYGHSWFPLEYNAGCNSLAIDENLDLLCGTVGYGMYKYFANLQQPWIQLTPPTSVNAIVPGTDGEFYLATSNNPNGTIGGCVAYDNNTAGWIQQNAGLEYDKGDGMILDRDGHLILFEGSVLYRSTQPVVTGVAGRTLGNRPCRVFPNPFFDNLTISSPEKLVLGNRIVITLYNSLGEKVYSLSGKIEFPVIISLPVLPRGFYFLQIDSDNFHNTVKLIH